MTNRTPAVAGRVIDASLTPAICYEGRVTLLTRSHHRSIVLHKVWMRVEDPRSIVYGAPDKHRRARKPSSAPSTGRSPQLSRSYSVQRCEELDD